MPSKPYGIALFSPPLATDDFIPPSVSCNVENGDHVEIGEFSIPCTATDAAGLTATCSFVLTVIDNEPPVYVDEFSYFFFLFLLEFLIPILTVCDMATFLLC